MVNTNPRTIDWKSAKHLYSRILVAGGGGGAINYESQGGYGDGGAGGAWKGIDGIYYDWGDGGEMDRGGYGGILRGWNTKDKGTTSMTHNYIVYTDGPYAGGYSCSDGMFGEGGYYTQPAQGAGMGGGGWYGGGSGGEVSSNGSGGGGSSFMWTDQESVDGRTLASYYDKASDLISIDANFFKAPSAKYPDYIPSQHKTPSGKSFPYFSKVVTKDAGVNAGDGWAKITLVDLDEDQ